MKKIYLALIILLSLIQFSCSNDDNDCLKEKLEIIEKYDKLIELAESDPAQKAALEGEKKAKLKLLDC